MATALVYDDRFLEHDTGLEHPECPERLAAITRGLQDGGLWDALRPLSFEPVDRALLERVHDPTYLKRIERNCAADVGFVDTPESPVCPSSGEVARLAAGGVVAAVDAVLNEEAANAFCAVRPPGHHAERDRSMGFCLLNNVAIAAEHLIADCGLERVAVVDFDVHHGNGTQHIFEDRGDVLYISLHQDPKTLFPGTGYAGESGRCKGLSFTINIPLAPGTDDSGYISAMDDIVLPRLDAFAPQFLLVSAGFDAARGDPLGNMNVTPQGFAAITSRLTDAADRHCHGRLVSMLEGGYNLTALAESAAQHVKTLCKRA